MDTQPWLIIIGTTVLLCAASGGGVYWWSMRKLRAAVERLAKVERSHDFSVQQTLQARKQIERLQKELASALLRVSALSTAAQSPTAAPAPRAALAEALKAGDAAAQRVEMDPRRGLPVHGFADTEPMHRGLGA